MKNSTFAVVCVSCITLTTAILATDWFSRWDIYEKVTRLDGKTIDIRHVYHFVPLCSPEHFWGRYFTFRDDGTDVPGDIYLQPGHACWDWKTMSWDARRLNYWPKI